MHIGEEDEEEKTCLQGFLLLLLMGTMDCTEAGILSPITSTHSAGKKPTWEKSNQMWEITEINCTDSIQKICTLIKF